MTRLQLKGNERTQAILEILKNAYKKLFETVVEPNKLTKEDLHNDFISVYNLSGRLATTAVPNFLWLCKEAGLEVVGNAEVKERKPRARNFITDTKIVRGKELLKDTVEADALLKDSSVEVGEFKLILPKDWDINKTRQSIVQGEFSIIYKELIKLSEKLKKNKNENSDLDVSQE